MFINMKKEGESPVLAGSLLGKNVRVRLWDLADSTPEDELLCLDFKDVEIATASFLREAVFEFRDDVRKRRDGGYPVVANANGLVIEELRVLADARNDVLVLCDTDENSKLKNPRLLGELEEKQRAAYELLSEIGEGDAKALKNKATENVGRTAWSNRLASLSKLGVVIEENRGRAKWYRPLFPEE